MCYCILARACSAPWGGIDGLLRVPRSPSRPREVLNPLTTLPRSRSSQPVIAATRLLGQRACGAQLRDVDWQVQPHPHNLITLMPSSCAISLFE